MRFQAQCATQRATVMRCMRSCSLETAVDPLTCSEAARARPARTPGVVTGAGFVLGVPPIGGGCEWWCVRGARPYLGARTWRVRRQDDRSGVVPDGGCSRPLCLSWPSRLRALAAGGLGEPAAEHLGDEGAPGAWC